VETLFFLPLMLLALLSIIYISQAAILSERVQFAVRYGSQITYPAHAYSMESMYDWYWTQSDPTTTDTACTPTRTAIVSAVYQGEQPTGAPAAYPTAPSYFQPSHVPVASCVAGVATYYNPNNTSYSPYMAFGFGAVTGNSVTATANVPGYLQKIVGATFSTQASMGTMNAAGAPTILGCRPFIAGPLAYVLSGNPKKPYNGYVAPNGNPHAC
jgi:hypothetical protein